MPEPPEMTHAPDWMAYAISAVLVVSIATSGFFAVRGVIVEWPRIEVALFGEKPV